MSFVNVSRQDKISDLCIKRSLLMIREICEGKSMIFDIAGVFELSNLKINCRNYLELSKTIQDCFYLA